MLTAPPSLEKPSIGDRLLDLPNCNRFHDGRARMQTRRAREKTKESLPVSSGKFIRRMQRLTPRAIRRAAERPFHSGWMLSARDSRIPDRTALPSMQPRRLRAHPASAARQRSTRPMAPRPPTSPVPPPVGPAGARRSVMNAFLISHDAPPRLPTRAARRLPALIASASALRSSAPSVSVCHHCDETSAAPIPTPDLRA